MKLSIKLINSLKFIILTLTHMSLEFKSNYEPSNDLHLICNNIVLKSFYDGNVIGVGSIQVHKYLKRRFLCKNKIF